ncbi:hypothetical protein [Amniculibacterium aquaticum]|uniref:hypothetical protein n=1 Tax=Amniculibacterium aquaticum TaxID=2479858 RepID=UPI000F5B15A4|nr:hypothetical protein [Amniculibacterium aquaticum]
MKKIISFCLIWLLIFTSCVTTKVNSSNKNNYSVLKENKTYIIKTKSKGNIRQFIFKNSTGNSIIGVYQNKELQISKDDILKINKLSLGKTIPVVFVGLLIGGFSIYMTNSPVFFNTN